MSSVAELSPEVVAQAKKLLARKQEAAEKAAVNAERYPGVVPGSTEFDPVAGKYIALVVCSKCGEEHSRYTSDLFQTGGLCPSCRESIKGASKATKKALLKRAVEAIRAGQV